MRTTHTLCVCMLLALGCQGGVDPSRMTSTGAPGEDPSGGGALPEPDEDDAAGGPLNTFHHPDSIGGMATDVREALRRMEEEGPPLYSARVHSCRKMRYRTLGRLLATRGIDLDAEAETSAGRMWRSADQALGAPNYGARIAETTELTVATSSRMFDIFVQAAPEIIANMPSRPECQVGGVGVTLFDEGGRCVRDGITCLLGVPATDVQVAVCNDVASRASTPEQGRNIAVAAMLAAANTCE